MLIYIYSIHTHIHTYIYIYIYKYIYTQYIYTHVPKCVTDLDMWRSRLHARDPSRSGIGYWWPEIQPFWTCLPLLLHSAWLGIFALCLLARPAWWLWSLRLGLDQGWPCPCSVPPAFPSTCSRASGSILRESKICLVGISAWAAATAKVLKFQWICLAFTWSFLVLLVGWLISSSLCPPFLLSGPVLRLLLLVPLSCCLRSLSRRLCLLGLGLDLKPEIRYLTVFLPVLLGFWLWETSYPGPPCLAVIGPLVLGLLDFGQRQWWIPASILPTGRRPWTLGWGTTLWFVLTVFLVLWSSGLPRPTGLPSALSRDLPQCPSPFQARLKPRSTCKLLDSTKIRSPSCLDPRTDGFGLDSRRQFVFSGAGDHRRAEAIRAGMAFRSWCRWTFRSDSCSSAEAPRRFPSWIASRFCSRDNQGQDAGPIGASTSVVVPGMLVDGGVRTLTGSQLEVVLVDVSSDLVSQMRLAVVPEEIAVPFDHENPFVLPSPVIAMAIG